MLVISFTTGICGCLNQQTTTTTIKVDTTETSNIIPTPSITPIESEFVTIPSITPIPTKAYEQETDTGYTLTSGGSFYITNYDACVQCCGNTLGITASGAHCSDSVLAHTVATDTSVIPFGTRFIIPAISGNEIYIAQDRGSAVIGNHIDIYQLTHEIALNSPSGYYEIFFIQE